MHLLIIYPNFGLAPAASHGVTALSGMLKEKGHKVSLLVLASNADLKESNLCSALNRINPDLIGFSLTANQKKYAKDAIPVLKRHFNVPILVGGVYPTLFPEFIEQVEGIDGLCRGEAEEPLTEYLDCLEQERDYTGIANWWFRDNGRIIKNPMRPFKQELDSYPAPDFEIFPKDFYYYPNMSFTRGCPFPCTYCCNHAIKGLYSKEHPYLRFKSVNRALEEVRSFIRVINPTWLGFDDDCITKNKEWLSEFCQKYPSVTRLPFHCNAFPSTVDLETCKMLKKAGCRLIGIGIESGDEETRTKVLKRPIKNEQIISAFRYAKEAGLQTHSFNMIGIPGESEESFYKTIELNKEIQPDYFQLTVFYPYEGTQLWDTVNNRGVLTGRDIDNFFCGESVLDLEEFSKSRIKWQYFWFGYNVYKDVNFKKALYLLKSNIKVYLPRLHKAYMKVRYNVI